MSVYRNRIYKCSGRNMFGRSLVRLFEPCHALAHLVDDNEIGTHLPTHGRRVERTGDCRMRRNSLSRSNGTRTIYAQYYEYSRQQTH
jgi:hypothetical protein